ncbi:MAG: PQQ-binding-like beta-propeller repeat protein [Euryarchaeota archaeon]|nr:PQQ-binding-like beta-propeller repeat protein [Euryarchaeota archaeon]
MKTKIMVVGLTLLSLLIIAYPAIGQEDWPMFRHDLRHTGYSVSNAPNTNNTFWTYTFPGALYSSIYCYPTVANGKVYIGTHCTSTTPGGSGELYCLDANGNGNIKIWSYLADISFSSPAVADGKVYVGTSNGKLYCLNATGSGETTNLIWSYTIGGGGQCPPTVANGRVYIGAGQNMYCLDANGTGGGTTNLIWSYLLPTSPNGVCSAPAVVNDKVYVGSGNYVYCLNATGNPDTHQTTMIWSYSVFLYGSIIYSAPAVVDGKVYISTDQALFCLDANGTGGGTTNLIWSYPAGSWYSSPAVAYGRVYVESSSGMVFCVDANGTGGGATNLLWSYALPSGTGWSASPAVADGKVYVLSYDGMFCLNATGSGGTTNLIWSYPGAGYSSSAVVVDGKVYGLLGYTMYCFRDDTSDLPPNTPGKPEGSINGIINIENTFTTSTTDPENNQVWYQWQFGAYTTTWIGPYNSGEQVQQIFAFSTAGTYDVKVKAKDSFGAESDWSPVLTVTITSQSSQLNQLHIGVDSTVWGGKPFPVIITDKQTGEATAGAEVTFNEYIQPTDVYGKVSFTAPNVTSNMVYTITASKEGYQPASMPITILYQQEENDQQEWIYGLVLDSSRNPLSGVSICAILEETGVTVKCEQTDNAGNYVFPIPPGTYTVTANKEGYEPAIKQNKVVPENKAVDANFVLTPKQQESASQVNDPITASVESFIQEKSSLGIVTARIDFKKQENTIVSYDTRIHIEPFMKTDETVSFTVGADDGTQGTFIVVHIDGDVFSNSNNIDLTYDGEKLPQELDVTTFFDTQQNTEPAYLLMTSTASGDQFAFVRIPHFSTHTITISSIVDVFGGPIGVLFYLAIAVIVALLFIGTGEITKRL